MQIRRDPTERLRRYVTGYWGFEEQVGTPVRRLEGPGTDVVLIASFDTEWLIDGELRTSFIGGLRSSQVETVHQGAAAGMHIGFAPWAAHGLFRLPMHELVGTAIPFDERLIEQLADARGWEARFMLLDVELGRRFADVPAAPAEVVWAWEQLRDSHGAMRIGALADELGWSRKRLVARFREHIGLAPKAVGRLFRFQRARALAGTASWGEIAFTCGYSDQPHLIAEFRAFTGRSPETFFQDGMRAVA